MSVTARPLSGELVGMTFEGTEWSWTERDVMLYALGVGARPDKELDFVYEGRGPKVLPTFAVIPGMMSMSALGGIDINPMMILHGEESITLHREIPASSTVRTTGRIAEVWDKQKAAVIGVEGVTEDRDGPMFTTKATIFVRGAGGFGGERGPSAAGQNEPPDRDPDIVVSEDTRPEQAAIYRLSGDRNPLHIDPSFAQMAGYEQPILHGLCSFGFVGRAILHALCDGDPARFASFSVRFSDVVYPGDTIVTKIWRTGDGEAIVRAETQRGNAVLTQARATYR